MLQQIFPVVVVFVALLLLAGFPAFISLLVTGENTTRQPTKEVMLSGIALFLYVIGFLGTYFLTYIKKETYKHHVAITCAGIVLFSIAFFGLQSLWNISNS